MVKFDLKFTEKGNVCINLEESCCTFINDFIAMDETIIMVFQEPFQ